MNLAIAVARSGNEKVGDCAVTYAAQQSCPASCPFKGGGGCYAENGRLYTSTTGPLNGAADGYSDIDVALAEADAIDGLSSDSIRNRPMRLHTVGDCASDDAALIVSAAAARYRDAGGGPVWTYTHAWRDVDRASWGDVSVLASCEDPDAVHAARGRGYAPSIVVDAFPTHRRYQLDPAQGRPVRIAVEDRADAKAGTGGVEVLPCPAQTRHDVTCASCRLCMNDGAVLGRGYAIGFAVHGTALVVKKALATLDDPTDERRKLTSRDHALAYQREHGRWPTIRELRVRADVCHSSAAQMLSRLRAA